MIKSDIEKRQPLPQITAAAITESVILVYRQTNPFLLNTSDRKNQDIFGGTHNES